jgi:RNA polymerase sigma factor (sigma-70 family)
VFVVLAKKAGRVAWKASVANWLYTTARKVAANARLSATRRTKRETAAAMREAVPQVETMTGPELIGILDEELDRLPPRYREPLVLCYLEGLTRDEAAARLGVSDAALKKQLERGRSKLAAALSGRGCTLGVALLLTAATAATSTAKASSPRLLDSILASAGGSPSATVAALARGAAMNGVLSTVGRMLLPAVSVLGVMLGVLATPNAATPEPPAQKTKPEKQPDTPTPKTLTGTVNDPDGKPVAGATVWLCRPDRLIGARHPAPKKIATTDASGKFAAEETPDGGKLTGYPIAASKAGFGVGFAWPDASDKPALRCSLALVPDTVPIRGRILDLQGKPVAGATVRPMALLRTDGENLDAWEKAARRSTREVANHSHEFFPHSIRLADGAPDGIPAEVKTAKDGTFTLTGLGRDRLVTLRVSGPGIATEEIDAVTRAMATIRTPQDKLDSHHIQRTYHGATFDFTVEPGQPFVGTVTDKGTGKPVPGVVVRASRRWDDSTFGVSDANGKYRLDGLKTGEQQLIAVPPLDAPYFLREFKAGRAANQLPVTADIELHAGVWVSGTVTDKATGKPVSASLSYRPDAFDTAADAIPGYLPRGLAEASWHPTDKDGKFRVLAVPGQGYVFVRATGGRYLTADQCDWQGDVEKPYPKSLTDSAPAEIASNWNAIGKVTVTDGKAAKEYAFTVDPGVTVKARIVDADGKPVSGALVTGRRNMGAFDVLKQESAEVEFLQVNPKRPRSTVVLHPEKHLGAVLPLKSDAKEAVTITLKPTGTVRGRLLSDDGKPMPNTPVEVRYSFAKVEGWRATELHPLVMTDAEGKFVVPNLLGELHYELRWPRPAPKAVNGYHQFAVKGGEEKYLGDIGKKSGDD